MKKLLLLILLAVMPVVIKSDNYYRALYFNIKSVNSNWVGWKSSNIRLFIDYKDRHIEIFSNSPQIINYSKLIKKKYSKYTLYQSNGTDQYKTNLGIKFQKFNSGLFYLIVEYSDYIYSYSLIEIDPD